MANFNIELRSADRVWETLEVERDDVPALRIEMARFVGQLLRDHAEQVWEDRDWRVDVTDETGHILFVMHLAATDSAATIPLGR